MTAGPASRPLPGPAQRRRAGRTVRWLLAALVLLPLLEVVILVAVGKSIGLAWTLVVLVVMAVLGAWLARRETGRTYRSLRRALESGRMPTDEATDAILVMVGGFLLILPGFLTDILGLVLVLPVTRPTARRILQAVLAARVLGAVGAAGAPTGTGRRPPGRGQVIEGEIVSETPPPGSGPAGARPLDR